ncbi:putative ferric-chelate reductase 1 homolog isoform X1 [Aedes albopictus]|uniref:Domon domain of stromal cell-derived receptor 2 n=1 Tax=Aedes albopictus TaxID=7160 RepID=A0ABM1ZQM0_AEDAL|nr:putative ferric-chelate reductase 1 homolog isoform X1 [Aedes albopictus]XP_019562158.1 putative ferric-chelate reductase 1 homolog isoform X1 [Aedes albopictus]XP_029708299.1 putative ferric-chelate reductase 1 homolog isoform X1 [Aedes albopictus]XP_029708300.1 putative ferric-chelate reductase 1 homolog isoform X1 [Aedes albopictus]
MRPLLSIALVLSALIGPIITLPNGAPESVCNTMLPFHGGGIPPLTTASPFRITPVTSVVGSGQQLQVEIESFPANVVFKGFMIQARNRFPPNEVLGQFELTDESAIKLINCGGESNTATHTNTQLKKDLALEWIAPANFKGEVVFNATIAQDYDKFWVGLVSTPVKVVESGQGPTSVVGISTTRQPPTTTTVPPYVPRATAASDSSDPIYQGCGDTKGCFGFPEGCVESRNCRAVVATIVQGERYIFEMKSGYNRPAYIAVGLSNDAKMGDDSVVECVPEQGTVNAYASWTFAGPYGVSRQGIAQNFIRLLEKSYVDGVIHCKVERDAVTTVKGQKFDLINEKYHLLLATGLKADSTHVSYHDIGRHVSGVPLALAEVGPVQGMSKLLLRLHGALMLTAWIGTASLGILLARYFRQTWVGSQLCGKDQWFAWHRFLMVLTWCLTVAGFVIIFVEIGGWSQVDNPHAILGVVTTVLCFLQPIGAYFRPHPGTKRRPLFNWLHWLGGNLAHIIAIVAIFFAVKLQKAELPEWLDFILVAFVAFHVFMHLIFSIFSWIQIGGCASERRNNQRVTSMQMADMTPSRNSMSSMDRKQDAAFSGFRKVMLFFYILIIVAFVVALVVITVLAPIEDAVESIKKQIMN